VRDFDARETIDDEIWAAVTDLWVDDPDAIRAFSARKRLRLTTDGKLVILAADHPARGIIDVQPGDSRLADRRDLLARVVRALSVEGVDGVMGTPDVIEELMALSLLQGGLLDGKVLIGCLNRGGLAGSAWEMDDRMTAYTPERLAATGLDGAKLMLRLDMDDPASLETLVACAEAVGECVDLGLPVFVEVFMVERTEAGCRPIREPRAMAQAVSIATALGPSSLMTWLKLPYCDGYEQVAAATTCPILMLGGAARGDDLEVLAEFAAGMHAGPNVRGCLVGRNVLYPSCGDPAAMAQAVALVVHDGLGATEAYEKAMGGI